MSGATIGLVLPVLSCNVIALSTTRYDMLLEYSIRMQN